MKGVKKILTICLTLAVAMTVLFPMNAEAATKPMLKQTKANIHVGDSLELGLKKSVKGAKITWSSTKKSIVTVDKKGTIKGVKKGKATIKCKVVVKKKTYNLECKVTVYDKVSASRILGVNNEYPEFFYMDLILEYANNVKQAFEINDLEYGFYRDDKFVKHEKGTTFTLRKFDDYTFFSDEKGWFGIQDATMELVNVNISETANGDYKGTAIQVHKSGLTPDNWNGETYWFMHGTDMNGAQFEAWVSFEFVYISQTDEYYIIVWDVA